MYQVFKEHIRGNSFVDDIDVVTMKLAILNSIMISKGEIYVSRYLRILGLPYNIDDQSKIVGKGLIFQYTPGMMNNIVTDICLDYIEMED